MPRRLVPLVACLLLALAAPAVADTGGSFVAGAVVDGSVGVQSLGDLDIAPDGTGAVAYVRVEDGAPRIFVSRFTGGTFQPPQRVDAGLPGAGADPVVAAADGGRLAVAWSSAGQLWAVTKATDGGFSAPVQIAPSGVTPSIDLSVNGIGYLAWTTAGPSVAVARLDRQNRWTVLPGVIDTNPPAAAGNGTGRPRVAVAADGIATVVWGEAGPDGRDHVIARKVFRDRFSTAPQDLTDPGIDGLGVLRADLPEVDAEFDSSYAWVVFRQVVAGPGGPTSRVVARRMRGTAFDGPVAVDGGPGSSQGRIDMNGIGEGLVGSALDGSGAVFGAALEMDAFLPASRIDPGGGAPAPSPAPALSENGNGLIAYVQNGLVRTRAFEDGTPTAEVQLSRPEMGPTSGADGLDAAVDRAFGAVIAWVQGGPGGPKQLVYSVHDRQPLEFRGYTGQGWRDDARLVWQDAFDLWGVSYTVYVDGEAVGTSADRRLELERPPSDGEHEWYVVATDNRGQTRRMRANRMLRLDLTDPDLTVRVRGRRARGARLEVSARGADPGGENASGIDRVRIDWGDGSPVVTRRRAGTLRAAHRYGRGTYTLRMSTVDEAGNATVERRRLRIR